MGAEKEGSRALSEFPAYLSRYLSIENIKTLSSESDPAARLFFYVSSQGSNGSGSANITKVQATSETLKKYLPKKSTPVSDFAKRYVVDAGYRKTAFDHMARIIGEDVSAISLNPVFGSLVGLSGLLCIFSAACTASRLNTPEIPKYLRGFMYILSSN